MITSDRLIGIEMKTELDTMNEVDTLRTVTGTMITTATMTTDAIKTIDAMMTTDVVTNTDAVRTIIGTMTTNTMIDTKQSKAVTTTIGLPQIIGADKINLETMIDDPRTSYKGMNTRTKTEEGPQTIADKTTAADLDTCDNTCISNDPRMKTRGKWFSSHPP